MSERKDDRMMNRRAFLERLSAGAGATVVGGALLSALSSAAAAQPDTAQPGAIRPEAIDQMQAGGFAAPLSDDPPLRSQPSLTTNPNILILMVDQLRPPQFWANAQQQQTINAMTPNTNFLRQNSYWFQQFYVAATVCTPSRATLLTGLYSAQTAQLVTDNNSSNPHALDTRFPTFGSALANLNAMTGGSSPNYNCFWFGKWHLSDYLAGGSLAAYGFNQPSNGVTPSWPDTFGSPDGTANEGNNGVLPGASPAIDPQYLACDAAIANDFIGKFGSFPAHAPWCATVSFVNPHDITHYPRYFAPTIPTGSQGQLYNPGNNAVAFKPHDASYTGEYTGSPLYPAEPPSFNYEDPKAVAAKGLALQSWYLTYQDDLAGSITTAWPSPGPPWPASQQQPPNFIDFLNWYFEMIHRVDQQIGRVLSTVMASPGGSNTVVILVSDHGEYGGSHGLRGKGGAVYDEGLRVPLYVMLPGQSGQAIRQQMCSAVDFFRLVVELAVGAPQSNAWWATAGKAAQAGVGPYADQATRQSLLSFVTGSDQSNGETRTVQIQGTSTPYILTTTDELLLDFHQNYPCGMQNHVICLRTKSYDDKSNPSTYYSGSKYAIYNKWVLGSGPVIDGSTPSQIEFYDYTDSGQRNRLEMGNNAQRHAGSLQSTMAAALGNGPIAKLLSTQPPSGLVASELMAPLTGILADGTTLASVSTDAMNSFNGYVQSVHTGCR